MSKYDDLKGIFLNMNYLEGVYPKNPNYILSIDFV